MNEPLKPPCCNHIVIPVLNGVFIGDMGKPTQDMIHTTYQKAFQGKEQVPFGGRRYTIYGTVPETIFIKDKTGFEYSYSNLAECVRVTRENESLSSDEVLDTIRNLVNYLRMNPTDIKDISDLIINL